MKLGPEAIDQLAREYVLGTLHGGARRRFEALQRESAGVAEAVSEWERRLGALGQVPRMQPSAALWKGLESHLFPGQARAGAGRPFWRWWLAPLGGAVAGAALCLLALQQQPQWVGRETVEAEALPQSYVGLLSDPSGQPVVLASSTRHGHRLALKVLQPMVVPPNQVARLWALPADGRAAFLVGEVPASGKAVLTLPDSAEHLFAKVSRLGVRLEPQAASLPPPSSAHDLPVSGPCVKLW